MLWVHWQVRCAVCRAPKVLSVYDDLSDDGFAFGHRTNNSSKFRLLAIVSKCSWTTA